jgi:predicted dienelactone hydrolase
MDGGAPGEDASPDGGTPADPAEPLFDQAGSYEITIAGAEDPATMYYPDPPDLGTGSYDFPVALLLQGANVERGYYSQFAERVARYGFVVVVPDHETTGMRGTGLYAEPQQTNEVLDQMVTEDQGSGPVAGAIDTDTLVLLGHSYGGVAGLYAIQEQCDFPFCSGSFTRPAALAGGAFYGTNMKPPFGSIPPVENDGLPVAYLQGDLDGKALLADTQETYDKTQDSPKLLVEIGGANHYGICDQDNPPGAQADSNSPTLDQAVAVETTARWAALFLRATVLADPDAQDYLSNTGPSADPNVTVTYAP